MEKQPLPKKAPWTNPSVLALALAAGEDDPVATMVRAARQVVVDAIDRGWSGPPFDPIKLATYRGLDVLARDDVRDARTVTKDGEHFVIEFNPGRPTNRLRYSIAHELAHTLFPDCGERIRHRAAYHDLVGDDWQLEALCNIGAAEILMPVGSFPELLAADPSIEQMLLLRQEFGVSMEALLIRAMRLTHDPLAMFCASRPDGGAERYRIDYAIASEAWVVASQGITLPSATAVAKCSAIGHTSVGDESWVGAGPVHVESVGIPPYPGSAWPRVVGIIRPATIAAGPQPQRINYLRGDALSRQSAGPVVVAQVVNDATANWGGRGFASGVRGRLPQVQDDFKRWAQINRAQFRLGNSRLSTVDADFSVFSMICQEGYGLSEQPRLRYGALQRCLVELAAAARKLSASVQMPRIGAGLAGGEWEIIEELIEQEVVREGVSVTVYDLPLPSSAVSGRGRPTTAD
jgi:hypothetical protein